MSDNININWAFIYVAMKNRGAVLKRQPGANVYYCRCLDANDRASCLGLPEDFIELNARSNGCLMKIDGDTVVLKGVEQIVPTLAQGELF